MHEIRISIIAIENHPDMASVAEYLQTIGAIPVYYDETADFCPYSPGDEIGYFKKTSVFHAVGFIPTWSLYVKHCDTVVVLADCESRSDELAVAEHYAAMLAKATGQSWDDFPVTLTGDDEPYSEYVSDWLSESGMATCCAKTAVKRNLPDATNIYADLVGLPIGMLWVRFSYRGKKLAVRITDSHPALFAEPAVDGEGLPLKTDLSDLKEKADLLAETGEITPDKMDTPPDSVRLDRLEKEVAELRKLIGK